jgi:hypothetical protein
MQSHGITSLYYLFADFVVLRNLAPVDKRLPSLAQAWQEMGLESSRTPRKLEPDYARACAWILSRAQELHAPGVPIRELLFVGDTAMNDGNAYRSLRRAGSWPGWAFIGSEKPGQPPSHTIEADNVYVANRWPALGDWLAWATKLGARCAAGTVAVVDMDKTAIGARGRNAGVIDAARVEGVRRTVAGLLGDAYDQKAFQAAYDELNEPAYHPFTADNQDYLAYICLMLAGGVFDLATLIADVQAGRMAGFRQFIDETDARVDRLPVGLQQIHQEVYGRVLAGDPTPFKAFRQNEYLATAARFGALPPETPVARLLAEQICVTQEVREVATWLRDRGCLLFTMSDKPDEATIPSPDLARQGHEPLHRLRTTAVGHSIAQQLANL